MRVLYVHGLEGSPQGHKAMALRKSFDVVAPAMDTSDFEGCVKQIAGVLRTERVDAVVGSSFGGAVAVRLLERGAWRGPTLLLAPAVEHFAEGASLPEGVQVVIVMAAGIALGTALYAPLSVQRVGSIPLRFETRAVVVWTVVLMLLGVLSSLFSARRVLRIDPVEATTGAGVQV